MAFIPAATSCTAWLPVKAPKPATHESVCKRFQSFSAPLRASEYSTLTEPLMLITSSAVYGRVTPFHLALLSHSFLRAAALSCFVAIAFRLIIDLLINDCLQFNYCQNALRCTFCLLFLKMVSRNIRTKVPPPLWLPGLR